MEMKFNELSRIVGEWNKTWNIVATDDGYRGIIRGKHDDDTELVNRTIQLNDSAETVGRSRVDAVLDKSTEDDLTPLPTVLCVGINYGQGAGYLTKAVGLSDATGMAGNLRGAIELLNRNQGDWGKLQLPEKWHLVAVNVFPWISQCEWTALDLNRIEEALLIYLFGYPSVVKAIGDMWEHLGPTIVVFQGAQSTAAIFGASILQAHPEFREEAEVIFTDNLSRPVTRNAVSLKPPKSATRRLDRRALPSDFDD